MRTILCFVILFTIHVSGLFEEQAGDNDWVKSNIGQIKHAVFYPSSKQKLAFVGTDANVVAGLHLMDGSLLWRQVLPEFESLDQLLYSKRSLVSISNQGGVVRMWNAGDGSLSWDLGSAFTPNDLQAPIKNGLTNQDQSVINEHGFAANICPNMKLSDDEHPEVVLSTKGRVRLLDGANGDSIWKWNIPEGQSILADGKGLLCTERSVYVFTHDDAAVDVTITALSFETGREELKINKAVSLNQLGKALFLSEGIIVYETKGSLHTAVLDLHNSEFETTSTLVSDLLKNEGNENVSLTTVSGSARSFSLCASGKCGLINVSVKGALEVVEKSDSFVLFATSTHVKFGAHVLKLETSKPTEGKVTCTATITSLEDESTSLSYVVPISNHGVVNSVFLHTVRDSSGSAVHYVLMGWSDHSIILLDGEQTLWVREEGLASVFQTKFVELPATADMVDMADETYPGFFQRLESQAVASAAFVERFATNPSLETLFGNNPTGSSPAGSPASATNLMLQDHFGFRKIILAVSSVDKLFGLDSQSGEIVWSRTLLPEEGTIQSVYSVQRFRFACVTDTVFETIVTMFDPFTGETLGHVEKYPKAIKILVVPQEVHIDDHKQHVLLLVDTSYQVHLYPRTQATLHAIVQDLDKIQFYIVDPEANTIKGYLLHQSDVQNNLIFNSSEIWAISFPEGVERISCVTSSHREENIISGIRNLGGSNGFLYKYLNPNMIVVATVRSNPTSGKAIIPGLKRTSDPSICIYLLDTITGTILQKYVHRFGDGPVYLAQNENSVVYHYFNTQAQQYEMSVLELYEDRDNDSFKGTEESTFASEQFSSRKSPLPFALQQTYVFPSAIRSLSVTSTRQGITSKEFLVGLVSNQLYSIPQRFLDPRRPIEDPTPDEKAMGLVPYMKELLLDHKKILSYTHPVHNIRGIESTPALLESSSQVFAFGLDMFFTHVTPSQTFDLLSEDFNHPFLIMTVSLVAVGIFFTQNLARKKRLGQKWK